MSGSSEFLPWAGLDLMSLRNFSAGELETEGETGASSGPRPTPPGPQSTCPTLNHPGPCRSGLLPVGGVAAAASGPRIASQTIVLRGWVPAGTGGTGLPPLLQGASHQGPGTPPSPSTLGVIAPTPCRLSPAHSILQTSPSCDCHASWDTIVPALKGKKCSHTTQMGL